MADAILLAQFLDAGAPKTGLTVTVDVYRIVLADGTSSQTVTGAAATETGSGLYHYRLASADMATYVYAASFETAGTADQTAVPALAIAVPDEKVGSRLPTSSYTAPLDAAGVRTAVGLASANLDTQIGAIPDAADIRAAVGLASANIDTQIATLPTAAEAATAVRSELTTELGRVDAAISTRLATAGYTAPPAAATNATAVRSELTIELGRIDAAVSTRLATAGYTAPLDAAGTRAAVGLATANADTQLAAIQADLDNTAQYKADVSALSTLDAAGVRTAIGLASANLDTQIAALPTDADVQTAAAAALTAYDPPTKAELDSGLAALNDLDAAGIRTAVGLAAADLDTQFDNITATVDEAAIAAAVSAGVAPAVWTHASRTLTQTAAQVTAAVTGSSLSIVRAVTFEATLTGLNISATWDKIYFTVKRTLQATDAQAALQVVVTNPAAGSTDGVLYVNGAAATVGQRTLGSLTINTGAGTIAIALDDSLTAEIQAGAATYDVKLIEDSESTLLTTGTATVSHTPTAATA